MLEQKLNDVLNNDVQDHENGSKSVTCCTKKLYTVVHSVHCSCVVDYLQHVVLCHG